MVLHSGDTLRGKIKDRTPEPFGKLFEKIRFKENRFGTKKYAPNDILAYGMETDVFETHLISNNSILEETILRRIAQETKEVAFLKVIVNGRLSYYHREFRDADSGYYDYQTYFRKKGETDFFLVPSGIFGIGRKRVANYFSDCPHLAERIAQGELKGHIKILEAYEKECGHSGI